MTELDFYLHAKSNKDGTVVEFEELRKNDTIDNLYDKEEIFPNCTVQVWTNTKTGKVSIGWWPND